VTIRTVTAVVLGAAAVGLVGWDIYAIIAGGVDGTISRVVLKASFDNPVIPFAMGFVSGHLFWPQPPPENKKL
jgi:hypothetical protein